MNTIQRMKQQQLSFNCGFETIVQTTPQSETLDPELHDFLLMSRKCVVVKRKQKKKKEMKSKVQHFAQVKICKIIILKIYSLSITLKPLKG